jgi:hypothetical protein
MAFARDTYTASAAQTDFTITFPYLAEEDVNVYEDGVLQTEGAANDYTIVTSTIVRFNSGRTAGVTVVLVRTSSQSVRLVDYTTASTLTEEDLDNDSLQAFYMAQEAIDSVNTGLNQGNAGKWDFQSIQSENVPTPTAGDSVVNKTYVDALTVAAGNVPTPDASEDGYVITADGVGGWDWQDSTTQWSIFEYLATGGQTSFTGADRNGNTMAFSSGDVLVFLNGILLSEGASLDYTVSGGTTITLNTGANSSDVLRVYTLAANVILTTAQTQTVADGRYLQITNDLSEVTAATALNNIMPAGAVQGNLVEYNGTNWVAVTNDGGWSAWTKTDLTNGGANDLSELDPYAAGSLSGISEFEWYIHLYDIATAEVGFQLSASSAFVTTGYDAHAGKVASASSAHSQSTAVMLVSHSSSTTTSANGKIMHAGSNEWIMFSNYLFDASANVGLGHSQITLAAEADGLRLTSEAGTANFILGNLYTRYR